MIKNFLCLAILLSIVTGIAAAGDVQVAQSPEQLQQLASQGYIPIVLSSVSGEKTALMVQGFDTVMVASSMTVGTIDTTSREGFLPSLASWVFNIVLHPTPANQEPDLHHGPGIGPNGPEPLPTDPYGEPGQEVSVNSGD